MTDRILNNCSASFSLNLPIVRKNELTREHFRVMIYYHFRQGLTQQQCVNRMQITFGDEGSPIKKSLSLVSTIQIRS